MRESDYKYLYTECDREIKYENKQKKLSIYYSLFMLFFVLFDLYYLILKDNNFMIYSIIICSVAFIYWILLFLKRHSNIKKLKQKQLNYLKEIDYNKWRQLIRKKKLKKILK